MHLQQHTSPSRGWCYHFTHSFARNHVRDGNCFLHKKLLHMLQQVKKRTKPMNNKVNEFNFLIILLV
uniref:Uncharacterized protein n=1 Tax=Anguilla anguilla TaxID=7936 RepID=A0A0E9SG95_ANGAN